MKMVNMMGARFSKPLTAKRVTHLICYKFEVSVRASPRAFVYEIAKNWVYKEEREAFEAGPKEIPITAVPGEDVRNPGAKRSRTPEDETAVLSVHNNCYVAASKYKRVKFLSSGSVEEDFDKKCSLNAAECTTFLLEETLSRRRNSVAKSPLIANSEMNEAILVYKTKPADVIMEDNPTTSAHPVAGKTKRVSFESSFHELVHAEGSTSKVSSSASADNPERCSPSRSLKHRVCKAVAKRRKVSSFQQEIYGSEACRTVSVLSEASKFPAKSSTNAGNWTVYKGFHNADEGWEDRSDLQSSKPRSSKRQKIDLNMENIVANTSLAPECVAVKNNEFVIDDCSSMTGGNDDGSSAVWEPEPTWFILSGHRLLRKQCRSILLRLKGRVCSHSDHCSFQATHFITPELRRAEKFFAASAAGRWILKPKYLFACDEAGKLVDSESLNWHGDGLNDNYTISMDSSRKWRHLKQRTGHGAFYGMQIIIYGECISPSLDTLRRAVRARDGMILATAPPYTRFLKLGAISFTVVSVGTPSSNTWVQEFKSHGVPCVSPSYLVDYVCKPSHLEPHKHVLFDMQDLADEYLLKLLPSQEGCRAEQSCSSGTMVVVAVAENMHGLPHPIEDASSNRKPVQIFIRNGWPTLTLNVKLDEPSRNIVETYKRTSNWSYSDFYFSYKNKIILPDRTLKSYGICKGCTIDLNIRVRGGGLSFEEYVETYKDTFTEIVKIPDGNLSLKVPLGGCQFLSSFLSCVMTTWSRNKSWNGQIQWNTHFKVTDGGIVQVVGKAITSLESSCMEKDIPPIIEFLDYAFSNKDVRLLNRRPPYFDHLIPYLKGMKSAVLSPVDKLVIASHPGYMLPFARLILTISIQRKYKGLSKQEKDKWDVAIEKASATLVWTDKLMELPLFKDVKEGADELGQSYPPNMKTKMSLRVSRDYSMHVLERRWRDDPNAKPGEKHKQIQKFKDDAVELMLPMHVKTFLANLIEELVTSDIDITRELSSALVHCTKCQIEHTPDVAEPIDANYSPTWVQALTKAQRSDFRRKVISRIIGTNPPRPTNWTTVPEPKATGESSTANEPNHPNPWNKEKTLELFARQTGTSSSRPPENSTAGAVQAQPANPMAVSTQTTQAASMSTQTTQAASVSTQTTQAASVSTKTTQAASVSTKTTKPEKPKSRAARRNAKHRENKAASKKNDAKM